MLAALGLRAPMATRTTIAIGNILSGVGAAGIPHVFSSTQRSQCGRDVVWTFELALNERFVDDDLRRDVRQIHFSARLPPAFTKNYGRHPLGWVLKQGMTSVTGIPRHTVDRRVAWHLQSE